MMLALLFGSLRLLAADEVGCAHVRAARGYAVAARLDTRTLDELERRLCGSGPGVDARPPGCGPLGEMDALAQLSPGGLGDGGRAELKRAAEIACVTGLGTPARWANGVESRSADGAWRYPNGVLAIGADGAAWYPSGVLARHADGAWTYPNGVRARGADGAWHRPDGMSAGERGQLAAWVCQKDAPACNRLTDALRTLPAEDHDFLVLAFAWRAAKGG
jgi:hypothetical protein